MTLLTSCVILDVYTRDSNSPASALLIYPLYFETLTNISGDSFLLRLIKNHRGTCASLPLFSAFAIRSESTRTPYPCHNSFGLNTYRKGGRGGTQTQLAFSSSIRKRPPSFPERAPSKSFRVFQPITGAASRSFRRRAKWCMAMFIKILPQEVSIESTRASVS